MLLDDVLDQVDQVEGGAPSLADIGIAETKLAGVSGNEGSQDQRIAQLRLRLWNEAGVHELPKQREAKVATATNDQIVASLTATMSDVDKGNVARFLPIFRNFLSGAAITDNFTNDDDRSKWEQTYIDGPDAKLFRSYLESNQFRMNNMTKVYATMETLADNVFLKYPEYKALGGQLLECADSIGPLVLGEGAAQYGRMTNDEKLVVIRKVIDTTVDAFNALAERAIPIGEKEILLTT